MNAEAAATGSSMEPARVSYNNRLFSSLVRNINRRRQSQISNEMEDTLLHSAFFQHTVSPFVHKNVDIALSQEIVVIISTLDWP